MIKETTSFLVAVEEAFRVFTQANSIKSIFFLILSFNATTYLPIKDNKKVTVGWNLANHCFFIAYVILDFSGYLLWISAMRIRKENEYLN